MEEYGVRMGKPLRQAVMTLKNYLEAKDIVEDVSIISDEIIYISRKNGLPRIKLFIIDAYVLGEGKTSEIIAENPDINCILVISKWNEYTYDAKKLAREEQIGLFTFSELMGAVFYYGEQFLDYTTSRKDRKQSTY